MQIAFSAFVIVVAIVGTIWWYADWFPTFGNWLARRFRRKGTDDTSR
jgi:hypothetical protein